ncbi:hypothetical protein GALL_428130 [mine drainage metagenome]|uniref:DUF2834 domain-containing protein n=1 Tax=mine drainage metagenome TaxID=410659 RepID=A0A1J5PV99_9ZZZZ
MVTPWLRNDAPSGLAWDLTITAIALILWLSAKTMVRRNWQAQQAILVMFGIGLSCGLPLDLFLRTRTFR